MFTPVSNVLKTQRSVEIIILKITYMFDTNECHLQFRIIFVLGDVAKQTE